MHFRSTETPGQPPPRVLKATFHCSSGVSTGIAVSSRVPTSVTVA